MLKRKYICLFLSLAAASMIFNACSSGGEFPGREYMPDMGHSIAYEANYYDFYKLNTWGTKDAYYDFAAPRTPVNHTVPMGARGKVLAESNAEKEAINKALLGYHANTAVPFDYENTEEERNRAMAEVIENPIPISEAAIAEGEELFNTYCSICHGEEADGSGYLVRDGGAYPAQPANFLTEEFINASNGRYYFALVHGKNVMEGYTDKLGYSERWKVIHYIRSLQAAASEKTYSEIENTLNAGATPLAELHTREGNIETSEEELIEEIHASEEDSEGGEEENRDETDTH